MVHIKVFEEFVNEEATFTKKDIKRYFPKAFRVSNELRNDDVDRLGFSDVKVFSFRHPLGSIKEALLTLHVYDDAYFNLYDEGFDDDNLIVYTPNRTKAEIESNKEVAKPLSILTPNIVKEIITSIKKQHLIDIGAIDRDMFGKYANFSGKLT